MAADELTKALLGEEVAEPRRVAEALFASVNGGVPLLQALVDSGAATPDVLNRYLARTEVPFLRQVVPLFELVDQLPQGLCARLLAIPVRHDSITGTVDVVVADPGDPHPASEISFHLNTPVRVVRASVSSIEEALRRLRMRSREDAERFRESAAHVGVTAPHRSDGDRTYESRSRADGTPHRTRAFATESTHARPLDGVANRRPITLPPQEPALSFAMPSQDDVPPRRGGLVIETDSAPPPPPLPSPRRTPPWGTPVHSVRTSPATEPPRSGYGSEIPIPLTRKTFHPAMIRGGTERPRPLVNPSSAGLGEGYSFDPAGLRDVVEKRASTPPGPAHGPGVALPPMGQPIGSFIPGPPPLPGMGQFSAYAPQLPFPEMGGVLAALRNAGSRDEVLELVLTGARMVAVKVALFVVKKGGYLGWLGTPEFADRTALQSVLIPLDANSIFDLAVREDLYLGPIRYDDVHAPLLRIMRNPTRDVAAVPIRVSGKTAVIVVADELGDTMIGTRRLEVLARAAGEAFGRIVRTRR